MMMVTFFSFYLDFKRVRVKRNSDKRERSETMAQRRRSTFENSPTGVLVLFASVAQSWLRQATEDEVRTAGRLLWEMSPPSVRAWALSVSRSVRQELDTDRVMHGIRLLVQHLRELHDGQEDAAPGGA